MANTNNVKMGVCDVTFNGVDLGHTLGGVEVTYEPEYADIKVDKYGNTLADKVLIGEKFMAKVPLAEFTIANLKNAIATATFAGAANSRITVGKSSGQRLSAVAYQLVLHPRAEGTRAYDVVIHKAVVASEVLLSHKIDEQKVIEVTFEGLIDETKSDGNYLGLIGDSTT